MDIHFAIQNWADHGEFISKDPSYWVPLMKYLFNQSDFIRIHCWDEEEKIIHEIQHELPELQVKYDMKMSIFEGNLTTKIIEFLTRNPLAEHGQIKWFSIFLSNNERHLFSSEHYGTEFFAKDMNGEQYEFIKSVMPKDTDFSTWN